MKKRLPSTKTGNAGIIAIERFCNDNNLIFQGSPREDFGVDCYVEIVDDDSVTGFVIGIQSKAGPSYVVGRGVGWYEIKLDENDSAYWLASNIPIFISHFDPASTELHMLHVQDYLASVNLPLDKVHRIRFDEKRDKATPALAKNIAELAQRTPSHADRLEIASCDTPVVTVNGVRTEIAPSPPVSIDILQSLGQQWHTAYAGVSKVIGFSRDSSWVVLQIATEAGMKCTESWLHFVHLATDEEAVVPLFLSSDYDKYHEAALDTREECGEYVLEPELGRRRGSIVEFARQLDVVSGVQVKGFPDSVSFDDQHIQPEIVLEFDTQAFRVFLAKISMGMSALVLQNDKFSPPRRAVLALERDEIASREFMGPVEHAKLLLPTAFGYSPRSLTRADEISFDHSGKFLVARIATNINQGGHGTSKDHYFRFALEHIRRICVEALIR